MYTYMVTCQSIRGGRLIAGQMSGAAGDGQFVVAEVHTSLEG